MKRHIKFRGICEISKEIVFGDLIHGVGSKKGKSYILPNETNLAYVKHCDALDGVRVFADSIGQFTGLSDKNGKEIFDGDIIEYYGGKRVVDFTPCDGLKLGIIYNEPTEGIRQTHENWTYNIVSSSVIIGNIHENKELIKQQ